MVVRAQGTVSGIMCQTMTLTPVTGRAAAPGELATQKASLSQFVEDHSKLITGIAAFIALAAFSSQLSTQGDETKYAKLFISGLSMLAAILLTWELSAKLPPPPHQWRLSIFANILVLMLMMLVLYWGSQFPTIWGLFLMIVVGIALLGLPFLLITIFSALALTRVIGFVSARVFRRDVSAHTRERVSKGLFFALLFGIAAALFWFAGRSGHR